MMLIALSAFFFVLNSATDEVASSLQAAPPQSQTELLLQSLDCFTVTLFIENNAVADKPTDLTTFLRDQPTFVETTRGMFLSKKNPGCTVLVPPDYPLGQTQVMFFPVTPVSIGHAVIASLIEKSRRVSLGADFSLSLSLPVQVLDGDLRRVDELVVRDSDWIGWRRYYAKGVEKPNRQES